MKPPDAATLTSLLGLPIDPKWLAVAALLVPIVITVVVILYKRRSANAPKKDAKLASPTSATAPDPSAAGEPLELRAAWKSFVKDLPSTYRRSILNFEHYVVFGDASHGKSRLVDLYTDWHRQEKQFVSSKPDNQELPLYITSRAVVMEIPAKVLRLHGQACKTALTELWKPLYQRKTPVVVVVVHAQKLLDSQLDEIRDLGETLRAKINVLAAIRGKPLEVRVTVTYLDSLEGYTDIAAFSRNNGMPLRIGLSGTQVDTALSAWFETLRAQLPRALTTFDTMAYGRMLRFLQQADRLIAPMRQLYAAVFAQEALSQTPIRGDMFFASEPASGSNPFTHGDRSAGPDPRLPHQLAAAVSVGAGMAFLGSAFAHQHAEWSDANAALARYRPDHVIRETEERDRLKIMDFTQNHDSFFDTFPGFFEATRVRMREGFSKKVRNDLLIPRLREVARTGKVTANQLPLIHQRSLYYLGLIHSDKTDPLSILATQDDKLLNRLALWSSMTGIETDLIVDYLQNTDVASRTAIDLGLEQRPVDDYDTDKPWRKFVNSVTEAMHDGVVGLEELEAAQRNAADLEPHLPRLQNVNVTLGILPALEQAGRLDKEDSGGSKDRAGGGPSDGLVRIYDASFGNFVTQFSAFRSMDVGELASMISVVRDAGLDVGEQRGLLVGLIDRLESLYRRRLGMSENGRLIVIGTDAIIFDEFAWLEGMRDSKARLIVNSFVQNASERDIFFDSRDVIQNITWNPTGGAAAVFVGRASIDGRYSRDMYESRVRRPVIALSELLLNIKMPEQDRKLLIEFVRKSVERYANNFRSSVIAFIKGFDLMVSSPEELRVALTQMSAETGGTSFDEFLSIVNKNTRLNAQSPHASGIEPMLAPAQEAMTAFEAWHGVVDQDKGAPKIIEYKKILQQLLIDLGGSLESAPAAGQEAPKEGKAADGEGDKKDAEKTIEKELTPAGRVFLGSIVDSKGAYWGLIRNWLAGTNLPSEQQWPFSLPLGRIDSTGRRDVETTVQRSLDRELMRDLERVANRFPFDRTAKEDVTPQELTALFHPKEGRVFDYFRRYLEPLSEVDGSGGFRAKSSLRGVRVSKNVYDLINAAARLSVRLWDETGKPRELEYRIVTVPFGNGPDEDRALTLVYLNVADGSLFNFNQKQTGKTLSVDWTKTSSSQVGVQLTVIENKENSFPQPINRSGSYFSLLRLLTAAEDPPAAVKEPPTAKLYTWNFVVGKNQTVRAQFVLKNDPWETFSLRREVLKLANP